MTREELLAQRNHLQAVVAERKKLGAFDANSDAIYTALESNLKLTEHILSKMKA